MAKAPADIRSLARKHTNEAIARLVHWMRSDNAKASVSASEALIDRGWGRAPQSIEISGDVTTHVIRAPAIAPNTKSWAEQHAPDHTQH